MSKPSKNMVVGCSSCSQTECPLSDESCSVCPEGHRVFSGWMFSFMCSMVFLMPILFAIVGSLLLSQTRELGILGGIAGFAGGWLISMGISRYCVIAKQ